MKSVKKSFKLYKENYKSILLLCLTIIFPIQLGYTFLINYVTIPFEFFHNPLWPPLLHSFFMLIALFLMYPPFISLVSQEKRHDEIQMVSCSVCGAIDDLIWLHDSKEQNQRI